MNDSKRLARSVLVMLVSTLIVYVINTYVKGAFVPNLLLCVSAISLFVFGATLNKANKKGGSVYRKVFALVCAIILVFMQMDAISLPFINQVRSFLSLNPILTIMLYTFFGYVFVD
ncbi:MAG: hypothetical protein RSC10_00080 [Longicatena sp.]